MFNVVMQGMQGYAGENRPCWSWKCGQCRGGVAPHAEGESAMQGGWRKRFSFLFLQKPRTQITSSPRRLHRSLSSIQGASLPGGLSRCQWSAGSTLLFPLLFLSSLFFFFFSFFLLFFFKSFSSLLSLFSPPLIPLFSCIEVERIHAAPGMEKEKEERERKKKKKKKKEKKKILSPPFFLTKVVRR